MRAEFAAIGVNLRLESQRSVRVPQSLSKPTRSPPDPTSGHACLARSPLPSSRCHPLLAAPPQVPRAPAALRALHVHRNDEVLQQTKPRRRRVLPRSMLRPRLAPRAGAVQPVVQECGQRNRSKEARAPPLVAPKCGMFPTVVHQLRVEEAWRNLETPTTPLLQPRMAKVIRMRITHQQRPTTWFSFLVVCFACAVCGLFSYCDSFLPLPLGCCCCGLGCYCLVLR